MQLAELTDQQLRHICNEGSTHNQEPAITNSEGQSKCYTNAGALLQVAKGVYPNPELRFNLLATMLMDPDTWATKVHGVVIIKSTSEALEVIRSYLESMFLAIRDETAELHKFIAKRR